MQWMLWEDEKLGEHQFYDAEEVADRVLPHRSPEAVRKRRQRIGLEQLSHCKKCSTPIKKHVQKSLCRHCKKKEDSGTTIKRKLGDYMWTAKKRNISWDLSLAEFAAMWASNCTYCGATIQTIGIDRIDNAKGYVAGNVTPCCNVCNSMKSGLAYEDWTAHMRQILNHLEGKSNGD